MTSNWAVIDFETVDPFISRGLGAGWVFELNYPGKTDFKVLGCAITYADGRSEYTTNLDTLTSTVQGLDFVVAHNAQYELGILNILSKEMRNLKIYDTKLMAKLYDNTLPINGYSLDALSKRYLHKDKGYGLLIDLVKDSGLYPMTKTEATKKLRCEKKGILYERTYPKDKLLLDFAYTHMDLLQAFSKERVGEYAILDAELTRELFLFFRENLDKNSTAKYMKLVNICVDYRKQGVNINLNKARALRDELTPLIAEVMQEIKELVGKEINIRSNLELQEAFTSLNIPYKLTDKGNGSFDSVTLGRLEHPLSKLILKARSYIKIKDDFVNNILDMQQWTCPGATDIGKIFPELNPFEAQTGRFSSSNPNIQNIPSKDDKIAPLVRGMFVPREGENWYSLDFSNQEGRLQVHYSKLFNLEGIDEIVLKFKQNPQFDTHQMVADMIGITRKQAKTIYLGLSYGMGLKKLAMSLQVSEHQAIILRDKFNLVFPYLVQLSKICKDKLKERGYIKSIAGRRLRNENAVIIDGEAKTFEYKGLNKLIQGSAADQTILAMIQAFDENIPVLFTVHDEMNISGTREQAERLKYIMENAVQLTIPSYTEVGEGKSWGEAK